MPVLQEVVEVRADLAGGAPAAQLPQGRELSRLKVALAPPRVAASLRRGTDHNGAERPGYSEGLQLGPGANQAVD